MTINVGWYKDEKLRVSVKLMLSTLKMSVGTVIVAKLSTHSDSRDAARITEAMRYNIQPNSPRA